MQRAGQRAGQLEERTYETPGPVVLDATAWAFLAIVLLTTPLQAASEERQERGAAPRSPPDLR